jgi:hypothetical protein
MLTTAKDFLREKGCGHILLQQLRNVLNKTNKTRLFYTSQMKHVDRIFLTAQSPVNFDCSRKIHLLATESKFWGVPIYTVSLLPQFTIYICVCVRACVRERESE